MLEPGKGQKLLTDPRFHYTGRGWGSEKSCDVPEFSWKDETTARLPCPPAWGSAAPPAPLVSAERVLQDPPCDNHAPKCEQEEIGREGFGGFDDGFCFRWRADVTCGVWRRVR